MKAREQRPGWGSQAPAAARPWLCHSASQPAPCPPGCVWGDGSCLREHPTSLINKKGNAKVL